MQVHPLEAVTFVSRGTDRSFTLFFSLFLDSEREAHKDEPSHALDVRFHLQRGTQLRHDSFQR